MMKRRFLLLFLLLTLLTATWAQGSIADYQRAFSLRDSLKNKVFYSEVRAQWIGQSSNFWYVRNTPGGKVYVVTDAKLKKRRDLFDHAKFAAALAKASGKTLKATDLNLRSLQVNTSLDTLSFVFNSTNWQYILRSNLLINKGQTVEPSKERYWAEMDEERAGEPALSPDGTQMAFVRNSNIYVKNNKTGKELALSFDGAPGEYYSANIRWSPDSKMVAAMKIRPSEKQYFYFVESSPTDQLQPKLHKREYLKPGDALPFKRPCIFNVETAEANGAIYRPF
jgi:hypothetical protein